MLGEWLTRRIEELVAAAAPRMPPEHREWGEAVVAEFATMPPGERSLRWALGCLWFVLRHADPPRAAIWASRAFAVAGVISVLPWLSASVDMVRDDAPDGTLRSLWAMLVAQAVVALAFAIACLPWRGGRLLLAVALAGYAVTIALSAADNGGAPVLAALVLTTPSALAALPVLLMPFPTKARR